MEYSFSALADALRPSEIREILKYVSMPGMISFGGGMPHPSSFPVEDLRRICSDLLEEMGPTILQYGTTQGYGELRVQLARFLKDTERIETDPDHVVLASGSQHLLYSLFKLLASPGEEVLSSSPTYIGALSAARANGVTMKGVPMDEDGILTNKLEDVIRAKKYRGEQPRFIYVVPNYQNPTGITLSMRRRKHLIEIASKYQIPVVEDNPYGELRYSGDRLPSLKTLDKAGLVIYVGTFSKIMSPGFRIGFSVAPEAVASRLNLLKQATCLTTNSFVEAIAAEYLKRGLMKKNLPRILKMYEKKRDTMFKALENDFGTAARWSHPDGGLFLWLRLNEKINTSKMLPRALKAKVAYVSGSAFYPSDSEFNTMRLNFSYPDDSQILEGIKRLAEVSRQELASGPRDAVRPS